MAKKKGFDLADPATLIGFIIGIFGTWLLGPVTGVIILVVATIVFAILDSKKVYNVIIGGLVGFLIGWLLRILIGAVFTLI